MAVDNSEPSDFSKLFKRLRIVSGFFSLKELSDYLTFQGIYLDVSILSRWQTGRRVPRSRETLLLIIQAFYRRGGLSEKEANRFLESAQFGYLTEREKAEVFSSP